MTNSKTTRKALLSSALALMMCVAMLIATTFAWFTDTASTSVNKIQAGTLKVGLEMSTDGTNWEDAEGQTLGWMQKTTADGPAEMVIAADKPLWEPGCTYELPAIRVVNEGNLAFKYKVVISGIDGDAELLKAIDFTVKFNGTKVDLDDWEGMLLPADKTKTEGTEEEVGASSSLVISGHMKETAGNDYQDKSIDGIGITVYATQYTYEYDSNDNQYDLNSMYVFDDYVNVITEVSTEEATVIKDKEEDATITAIIPKDSLQEGITELALIKKPTANPDSVKVETSNSALTTDVKIIDTKTKKVISAQDNAYFTINIQLGQVDLQKFYHKGVELTKVQDNFTAAGQYKYDFATGIVTFTTDSFSTFTAVFKYSGGDGTEANPYLLGTANDLFGIKNTTADATGGKYFKLVNDIELPSSWANIAKFAGTIDGNNKTIKFTGTDGLINILNCGLDKGSTIKDLTLTSTTAENALLAYLAYCSEDKTLTISNVTTNGSVSYVAAMIGWLYTTGSGASDTTVEALIENCTNNASVTNINGNRAVGLVGTVKTLNVEFRGCVNNGKLEVENGDVAHAAGIAGYVMKMATGDTSVVKITNCSNTGAISATSTSDGRANVGGIISTAHQGTFTITNCTNSGNITGTDSAGKNQTCVGGIVGRVNSTTTISGCSNSGAITATATTGGKAYAGGAVGYDQQANATIDGFENAGTITPDPSSAS